MKSIEAWLLFLKYWAIWVIHKYTWLGEPPFWLLILNSHTQGEGNNSHTQGEGNQLDNKYLDIIVNQNQLNARLTQGYLPDQSDLHAREISTSFSAKQEKPKELHIKRSIPFFFLGKEKI